MEKFDPNGAFVAAFGGPGRLNGPQQVRVDPQGNVLVNDSGNYRIIRFDQSGASTQAIGGFGTAPGSFNGNPIGLGVDAAGNVYVLDRGDGGVVSKFAPDGTFATSWNYAGSAPGQWSNPHGLGVTPDGGFYVGDSGNRRIDAYSSDGTFIRSFGSASGPDSVGSPNDIAIDSDGSVFVSDGAPSAIIEFDSNGAYVGRTTTASNASDRFAVNGIGVGPNDDVYATDRGANRVLHFKQVAPTPTLGKTANAAPVSGVVKVRLPGGNRFVTLGGGDVTQIPVGSLVDTSKGAVKLTLAKDTKGATQSGTFSRGQFGLRQSLSKGSHGLAELTLTGPQLRCASGSKAAAARRRRSHQLFADVHGRFRTRGRHSTATVRGTAWLTKDTCAGTLTSVKRGVVIVRDLGRKRNIRLTKGHKYLAKPRHGHKLH